MSTANITNGDTRCRSPTRVGCRIASRRLAEAQIVIFRLLPSVLVTGLVLVGWLDRRREAVLPLVSVRLRLRARHRTRRAVLDADSPRRGRGLVGGFAACVREHQPRDPAARGAVRAGVDRHVHGQPACVVQLHPRSGADGRALATSMACEAHLLQHAVLPRAARALLRGVDRLLGRDAALVCEAGRDRRHRAHAQDALVGTVGCRAARINLHVLRVRHFDEPAILVVQHYLRRVLLGRRYSRLARYRRTDRACAAPKGYC